MYMVLLYLTSLLSSNAVCLKRDRSILYSRITITGLIVTIYLIYENLSIMSYDKGIGVFGGLFHATPISHSFQLFVYLLSSIILILTGFYPRKIWLNRYLSLDKVLNERLVYFNTTITDKMSNNFKIIEYALIVFFVVTGASFLMSSSDIVSIFLSIELQSYGLYLICTFFRNSESATSAGLTYFLLGGLSSCFILLGQSLLYSNTSVTSLDGYYIISSMYETSYNSVNNLLTLPNMSYFNISLLIMSVGFLFKISAAPFHFWSPDVYDAIPTVVTTFVAIIAKISILIILSELVHYTSNNIYNMGLSWTSSLLISTLLSLIIGTVLGLTQFRIKRLLAYSTISHIGFILLALGINSIESIQAFIFYLMQYSITNLNAFILLISIGYTMYMYVSENEKNENLIDKNNSPIQLISQLKGYFYNNAFISLSLAITMFSFVGIPPLIGFFAKQMVLSSALDNGYLFLTLVAILTSVISAVYYLNLVSAIFFNEFKYKLNNIYENFSFDATVFRNNTLKEKITLNIYNIVLSNYITVTISILTLVILLFILKPEQILRMTNILAIVTFNS